jgi:hypothetical protein
MQFYCNCCAFKAIQNCPLRIPHPLNSIFWDEKLINIQHIENDLKVYWFYRKLFLRDIIVSRQVFPTTVLFGDRVEQLANYYIYCYDYRWRVVGGEREISVGVIDWKRQAYVKAKIICGIYPGKFYRKKAININPIRTVISIEYCSTIQDTYISSAARRDIERVLDSVVTILYHDHTDHEKKLQQTILRRFVVCLSIRLIQFLKYAIRLQVTVRKYCHSNCKCGGFGGECICPVVIRGWFKEFPDARKMCSDEVFFEAPLPG